MNRREIDLNDTDIKDVLRVMMAESQVDSLASIARDLDTKETTLRSSIARKAIRLEDFKQIASLMGYTVVVKPQE